MAEKERLTDWVKKHKKELLLSGVSVSVILALIIGIKNRDERIKAWKPLIKLADEASQRASALTISVNLEELSVLESMDYNNPQMGAEFMDVCSHIRNLPEGRIPSVEKIASAAQRGYELKPGQTWVEQYTKRKFAA